MDSVEIFIVDELVGLLPNTYYLHREGEIVKSYLTDQDSVPAYVVNGSLFNFMISVDEAGDWTTVTSQVIVVDTIEERNSLSSGATTNLLVFVNNSSEDPALSGSGSLYVYRLQDSAWYEITSYESTNVVIGWDDVIGRPSSEPYEIDDAVDKSHWHDNKAYLDKISEDLEGNLLYDDKILDANWHHIEW